MRERRDMPPAANSDALIVLRLLQRDRTALPELCSLHGSPLYTFGYRLTGKHDRSVDLAVETLVRVCSRRGELERQVDLSSYLTITAALVFLEEEEANAAIHTPDSGTPDSAWAWDDSEPA